MSAMTIATTTTTIVQHKSRRGLINVKYPATTLTMTLGNCKPIQNPSAHSSSSREFKCYVCAINMEANKSKCQNMSVYKRKAE